MVISQNGWPASANRAEIHVEPFTVGSVAFPGGVRAGAVAAVLGYLVTQFHARVEPLVEGWCWGYAWRDIRGGTEVSNHASGTAVDINAPRHPIGAEGTFTAAQRREVRKILRELMGVVRWGGDYTGRKDEMHFEIIGEQADLDRVVATLTNSEDKEMSALTDTVLDIGYRLLDWLQGNEKQTGGKSKGTPLPAVVDQNALKWRVEALINGRTEVNGGPTKGEPVALVAQLNALHDLVAELVEQGRAK